MITDGGREGGRDTTDSRDAIASKKGSFVRYDCKHQVLVENTLLHPHTWKYNNSGGNDKVITQFCL